MALKSKASFKPVMLLAAGFFMLTLTACDKKNQWLECHESRGWEDPEGRSKFYINIKRTKEKTIGQYLDQHNNSPASIKESPVTIYATANIRNHPSQKGIVQVTYSINKENLQFSKTTRNWLSNQYGKPENLGGITISRAGSCKLGEKPSSKL